MKDDHKKTKAAEPSIEASAFDGMMRRALSAPPLPPEQRPARNSKKPRKK